MAKGSRPLPLPGLRGPHTRPYWPPTGQKRPPSLAPTGQLTAQRPPTGHLWPPPTPLATYWPSGEAPHWPPTSHKGTGGDAFARPSPDWQKGREGEPLATRELQPPPTSRPPDGVGFFACKGGLCDVARANQTPFGAPLALSHRPDWPPTGLPTSPTDWPPKGTGLPLPTGHLRPLTD